MECRRSWYYITGRRWFIHLHKNQHKNILPSLTASNAAHFGFDLGINWLIRSRKAHSRRLLVSTALGVQLCAFHITTERLDSSRLRASDQLSPQQILFSLDARGILKEDMPPFWTRRVTPHLRWLSIPSWKTLNPAKRSAFLLREC